MTDRELLELSAKAAGIVLWQDVAGNYYRNKESPIIWNPLTDDGDALRLAVRLGLYVQQLLPRRATLVHAPYNAKLEYVVEHDDDPYSATRRAIVLSAAQIGKELA